MLSSEEIRAKVPGLTYRMLYTWTQNGYIQPDGGVTAVMFGGPGRSFHYPSTAVPLLRRMVALTRAGFSPKSASALAHADNGVLRIGEYTVSIS